jgi:colanic acid biosynthesis glycosyl transferase WcaI
VTSPRKPRWLILTQFYHPELGAPQLRLRSMVRELGRHGIDVEVLTALPNYPKGVIFPGYEGRLRMSETIDGIAVRRVWIHAGTGKSALTRILNYLSFTASALFAVLFSRRPDVLFLESQPLTLGFVAVAMKWLRGVPFVYNIPDLQADGAEQLGFLSNKRLLRALCALEDFFIGQSWKVSTVTDRFITHFEARGVPRAKLTFLPNGADTDFLAPRAPDPEMLERWGLHGKKVFLYVGTHAYYHGMETLVRAAALLRERADIVFLMIGSGPVRQGLIDLARELGLENVIFSDSPFEERAQLYSISYASLASLRDMELARKMRLAKIFPSLACGVPVVHSGWGEGAELLESN